MNGGAYGDVLAGHECILGRYPVTESLLKLVSAIISQVSSFLYHLSRLLSLVCTRHSLSSSLFS